MKRARESEQRTTSPIKRPRKDSFPATPYTPYPQRPSDSPSNPFKRKTNVVSLPPISSFRKHIPLRFQFHRPGIGFRKGGVHRIVQVPLDYTFTHLRALVAWLLDVPAKCTNGKAGEEDYLFEVKTSIAMESTRSKPGMIKCGETSVKLSNSKHPLRPFAKDADDQDELEGDQSEGDDFGENLDDASGDWIWADEQDYTLGHVWVTGVQADRGIIYASCHHYPSMQVHITVNTTKLPRRRGKSNVPYIFSAQGCVRLSPRPLPRPLFTKSILHTLSSSPAGPSRLPSYAKRASPGLKKKRDTPSSRNPFNQIDDLSDMDADGDNDPDQTDSDMKPFDNRPCLDQPSRLRKKTRKNFLIFVDDSEEEGGDEEQDEDEDEDVLDEDHDCSMDPDHWNWSHYAFGRYLLSFVDPRGRSYSHFDDEYFEEKKPYDPFENDDDDGDKGDREEAYVEEESMEILDELEGDEENGSSTPGLTRSSSRCGSSLPPSSPAQELLSSPAWQDDDPSPPSSIDLLNLSPNSSLELHPSIIASHYPNKKYSFTPAPPIARKHRQQLERMERRLERGKKGTYLCEYDEVADDEVDELLEEDEEGCVDEAKGKWVRPVLKEGEVWDPFGDEEEV